MTLPSPDGSGASTALISSSNKTDKSSASVRDTDYWKSLGYRNIYIECEDPPVGLMKRAKEIITGSRSSPEVDEAAALEVKKTSRLLRTKNEENIIQELALSVIPGINGVPDPRLASSANQQWTNFVPIPLDLSILTDPLPLPRPKPDKAFGYSEKAFTRNQLATIDLLTDPFKRSYATPDKELLFPFLDDEFKSQGKCGSHAIATNQAAGAGAVAMNGFMELTQRGLGLDTFDYDEPQFFSLSVDHSTVHVYVHWLRIGTEDRQLSFHMEELSQHNLRDLDGLRAVHRTVKNILDWGRKERLPAICKLLDTFRDEVQREKVKAVADAKAAEEADRVAVAASEGASVEIKPRNGQKQKGRKGRSSTVTATAPNAQNMKYTKRAPPLILQSARALSDFIPKPEDEQSELGFKKGETIEFVDAEEDENGWLKGRIRGGDGSWGFVPAEYLELKKVGETALT
jgi:Variant SH3 domain